VITSTTDAIAITARRPRADFSAAADRAAARLPGPLLPGPEPPGPEPPGPDPPFLMIRRPPPDSLAPAAPGRAELRLAIAARSSAAEPAAPTPRARPEPAPSRRDAGASAPPVSPTTPPDRPPTSRPPARLVGLSVGSDGVAPAVRDAADVEVGAAPREAQSSAARREDQVPAVSPRGASERAARRARLGGSGSLPAMDCSTHDGVPPAGRRLARPDPDSSAEGVGRPDVVSGAV
jgi:hypothetical protein